MKILICIALVVIITTAYVYLEKLVWERFFGHKGKEVEDIYSTVWMVVFVAIITLLILNLCKVNL